MLEILFYTSIVCGGILILMLILSLLSGLDLDIDFDLGDTDLDAGGLGILKGVLTFFSVGAWVVRIVLLTEQNPVLAFAIGIGSGLIAIFLLSKFLTWLLRNQENVNWTASDALYQKGKVYLKIPAKGEGIIHVNVKGVNREIKAITNDKKDIPTGSEIVIEKVEGNKVIVSANID